MPHDRQRLALPIALLGPSPTWYKSEAYRSRVVRDPRGVLAEFRFLLAA